MQEEVCINPYSIVCYSICKTEIFDAACTDFLFPSSLTDGSSRGKCEFWPLLNSHICMYTASVCTDILTCKGG